MDDGIEKLDQALAIVNQLLETKPDNAEIQMERAHLHNELGNLHERNGDLSQAVDYQNRAMSGFEDLLTGEQRAEALQGLHTTQGNMAVALENRGQYKKPNTLPGCH